MSIEMNTLFFLHELEKNIFLQNIHLFCATNSNLRPNYLTQVSFGSLEDNDVSSIDSTLDGRLLFFINNKIICVLFKITLIYKLPN